jgi:SAM-dependent MidA family methyltransferase
MKTQIKTDAALLIEQEVRLRGPMTFARFVEIALYHPRYGYYNRRAPQRGRAGDYFTAPQVGGLFARIFADLVLQMKESVGSDQFALIETGAGDGEFLHGVLTSLEARKQLKGLRVFAVERGRPAREKLWKMFSRFPKCQVVGSLEEIEVVGGVEGCFFSNELFDALPFHRLRLRKGAWQEIYVDVKDNALVETEGALTVPAPPVPSDAIEGQEIEVRPAVNDVYAEWGTFMNRGYVVTFDYGHPRATLQAPNRPQGTWLCYYKHQAHSDAFAHVGDQDMTAHVDFTQLAEAGRAHGFDPLLFCTQGIFLTHTGKDVIPAWLTDGGDDLRAQKTGALQQLVHPDAMGETFKVLVQSKDVEPPPVFAEIPNRLKRLGL